VTSIESLKEIRKICIIGSAGSGKSTLAIRLAAWSGLPVIHLDKHYWKPGWVATPSDEWDQKIESFIKEERWILDGNYSRTLSNRVEKADLVVFLDVPRWVCLFRVLKRRVRYHKKNRDDMAFGCIEKIDFEFLRWIWNFPRKNKPRLLATMARFPNKMFVRLRTSKEMRLFQKRFERLYNNKEGAFLYD